jgi:hypothetical protein
MENKDVVNEQLTISNSNINDIYIKCREYIKSLEPLWWLSTGLSRIYCRILIEEKPRFIKFRYIKGISNLKGKYLMDHIASGGINADIEVLIKEINSNVQVNLLMYPRYRDADFTYSTLRIYWVDFIKKFWEKLIVEVSPEQMKRLYPSDEYKNRLEYEASISNKFNIGLFWSVTIVLLVIIFWLLISTLIK